jgi:hypothetical protein
MAKTVSGTLKLDGDLRHFWSIKLPSAAKNVVDYLLADEEG